MHRPNHADEVLRKERFKRMETETIGMSEYR